MMMLGHREVMMGHSGGHMWKIPQRKQSHANMGSHVHMARAITSCGRLATPKELHGILNKRNGPPYKCAEIDVFVHRGSYGTSTQVHELTQSVDCAWSWCCIST